MNLEWELQLKDEKSLFFGIGKGLSISMVIVAS